MKYGNLDVQWPAVVTARYYTSIFRHNFWRQEGQKQFITALLTCCEMLFLTERILS